MVIHLNDQPLLKPFESLDMVSGLKSFADMLHVPESVG